MLPANYQCEGQMSIFDFLPQQQFGRTSPELSVQEVPKEQTLDVSSRNWLESKTLKFQYLCLTRESGCPRDISEAIAGLSHGEPTMHSIGESPSEEEESAFLPGSTQPMQPKSSLNFSEEPTISKPSKLSQILEKNADPKYYLSAKACLGILRRAQSRGRQLPELLERTLRIQSGLSAFRREPESPAAEKDSSSQRTESDRWEQAQTNTLSIEGNGARPSHHGSGFSDGAMYTLNAVEHHSVLCENDPQTFSDVASSRLADDGPKGVHSQMMREPESNFVLETPKCLNSWDVQSKHIQPEDGIAESLYSGECRGGGGESYVMQTPAIAFDRAAYNQGQNAQYNFSVEEELAQTIVAKGPGGGNADVINSLCARDWKGVGNQYVSDGKCIIQHLQSD